MSIKKKKEYVPSTRLLKMELPYQTDEADTMTDFFERYKNDPAASIIQNGRVYYRIIAKGLLERKKETLILCNVDSRLEVKIGDQFEDEFGNRFTLKCVVMASFGCEAPEWYFKAPGVLLTGDYNTMGEYLTVSKA